MRVVAIGTSDLRLPVETSGVYTCGSTQAPFMPPATLDFRRNPAGSDPGMVWTKSVFVVPVQQAVSSFGAVITGPSIRQRADYVAA